MAAGSARRSVSVFEADCDLFDSARLLRSHPSSASASLGDDLPASRDVSQVEEKAAAVAGSMWTCQLCRGKYDSLQDQRAHFKSDLHRLNVKLSIAGKTTIKEEEFDESTSYSYFDNSDVSSISGSEDEVEDGCNLSSELSEKRKEELRKKLFFRLRSGEVVSLWRCLLLSEFEEPLFDSDSSQSKSFGSTSYLEDADIIKKLKDTMKEPRDRIYLRIILLISGGHFAGCVFDGNTVIAHKTFHRYVVRAKAGKKQSSKDGTGKVAHSAGSSLRRYNEAALKKDIQDLIVSWKSYFDSCNCTYIYAPSRNRQIFFDGGRTQASIGSCKICQVPLTCRRPTLKEAKRVYSHLTQVTFEMDDTALREASSSEGNKRNDGCTIVENILETAETEKFTSEPQSIIETLSTKLEVAEISSSEDERETTRLHEAAKVGDAPRVLELLEEGLNPCIRDERGRTPYTLASDKEVRNTFRRFMASNPDKWDWHAANVPSALTKEMEESQAAKQAEKDAKRKAKAKDLKKLKKAKEKAKAQTSQSQQSAPLEAPVVQRAAPLPYVERNLPWSRPVVVSEEARQRSLAEEREKRAAAAERRIAALAADRLGSKVGASDALCSYCNASLEGKVPFHRYSNKYCSPTCMHVHREILEDG